jgi:hypothetical protein
MEPNKYATRKPNTEHNAVHSEDNHEAMLFAMLQLTDKISQLTFTFRPIVMDVDRLTTATSSQKMDILKELTSNVHNTMMLITQLNDHIHVANNRLDSFLDDTLKLITDLDDSAHEANKRLEDFTNSTTINGTPNLASTIDTRKRPYKHNSRNHHTTITNNTQDTIFSSVKMAAKTQAAAMKTAMGSETMPPVLLHDKNADGRNSHSSDSDHK